LAGRGVFFPSLSLDGRGQGEGDTILGGTLASRLTEWASEGGGAGRCR